MIFLHMMKFSIIKIYAPELQSMHASLENIPRSQFHNQAANIKLHALS